MHTYVQYMLDLLVWKDNNVHDTLSWIGTETMKISPCLPSEIENKTTILAIHHHDHHYGDTPALRKMTAG